MPGTALPAAVVHDGLSAAVMRSLIRRKFMPVRAGKPLWMKRPFQVLVAFLLTEKLVDGKTNHRNTSEAISWNTPWYAISKRRAKIVQLRANMSQDVVIPGDGWKCNGTV